MIFTRQFRALLRISSFFAATWAAVGGIIGAFSGPTVIGGSVLGAAATFAIPYGLIGGMAGALTVLLVARLEAGKDVVRVPIWRFTVSGIVGGMAPTTLLSALGLIFGAPVAAVLPLLGIGIVGGALGGAVCAAGSAAAKADNLSEREQQPQLPVV